MTDGSTTQLLDVPTRRRSQELVSDQPSKLAMRVRFPSPARGKVLLRAPLTPAAIAAKWDNVPFPCPFQRVLSRFIVDTSAPVGVFQFGDWLR